jgi:hypothetical protein
MLSYYRKLNYTSYNANNFKSYMKHYTCWVFFVKYEHYRFCKVNNVAIASYEPVSTNHFTEIA